MEKAPPGVWSWGLECIFKACAHVKKGSQVSVDGAVKSDKLNLRNLAAI